MSLKAIYLYLVLVALFVVVASLPSCTHEPVFINTEDPIDTTGNVDTTGTVDTTDVNGIDSTGVPCDSNVVYFEYDVFPILKKNCAYSGCHGGGTHEEGVNLENYASTLSTGGVRPNNLSKSELYEVITSTKASKVMPPPPNKKLTADEINIIAQWINQGAKNEVCNPNYGKPKACDASNTTYSGFVKKVVDNECVVCHKASLASGGVRLDGYDYVSQSVKSGRFLASIQWKAGYVKMPYNQKQLDSCSIKKIVNWIDNGAQNN